MLWVLATAADSFHCQLTWIYHLPDQATLPVRLQWVISLDKWLAWTKFKTASLSAVPVFSPSFCFLFIDRNCRGWDGQNGRWQSKAGQSTFHKQPEGEKKKKKLNSASSGPIFSWSPAAQCLTVFLSEDMVLRTTKSCTVSLQLTSQVHSKNVQWATLYLSEKNTLLYHCFVPLTI